MGNNLNKEQKAVRLLGGRRYTHATDKVFYSQEAFTKTIDIGAGEIYTQVNDIPSTAAGLPYSSDSDDYLIVTSSTGENILRYWYRHKLIPSNKNSDNSTTGDTFFFLSGSALSDVDPLVIQSNQQTDFISPKYITPADAGKTAEEPGYKVWIGSSTTTPGAATQIGASKPYSFDYKTGVLQFETARSSNEIVYMSAYQYVGTTLATGLEVDGNITAKQFIVSSSVTYMTSSFSSGSTVFGDSIDDTHQFTGSLSISGSILPTSDDLIDLGSSTFQFKDLHLDGTANIDELSITDGFTYNGVTFNTSGSGAATSLSVTGSQFDFKANNPDNLFTLYNTSDEVSVQIDDKVIVVGESATTPTAVAGGMFYSSSAWFLGYENSPT